MYSQNLEVYFSNSLITHEPNFQSDCWVFVYRVWYLVKDSLYRACFHLASDWRGRFMSHAWVFISNRMPDEGMIGSVEDHCRKSEIMALGKVCKLSVSQKNPAQVNNLNGVASLTSVWHKSSILQLANMESRLLLWCFSRLTKNSKSLAELNGSQSEIINFYSLPIYYLENGQILYI